MSISDSIPKPALVLLGDTASVPHHAGALQVLQSRGLHVEWVCGSSGGAISAAIIAGNPPEKRMDRLREFWEVYEREPRIWSIGERSPPWYFAEWLDLWWGRWRSAAIDTVAARNTLERLIDFDLLNSGEIRMTTLATNIERGTRTIFDNVRGTIRPEHILASSLGVPNKLAVNIEGEYYWNDDWLSLTPLQFILDEDEVGRRVVFVVDPWGRERPLSDLPDWQQARAREIADVSRISHDIKNVGNTLSLDRIVGGRWPRPRSLSADTTVLEPGRVDVVHALSNAGEALGEGRSEDWRSWDRKAAEAHRTIERALLAEPWKGSPDETPFAVHTVSGEGVSSEIFPGRAEGTGGIVPRSADLDDALREMRGPVIETYNLDFGPKASVTVPEVEPAPTPLEKPGLIFKLVGEHANADEVVWGTPFDLVVDYGTALEDALAAVTSEAVASAVCGPSAELGIMVTPRGFTLRDGRPIQPLKFENGQPAGERPRFKLLAPEPADIAPVADGPCGVWVVVTKARAPLHTFFLEIHLVETLRVEAAPPPHLIDFDLMDAVAGEPEERIANINITSEGDSWRVYWDINGVQSAPRLASLVTPAKLKAAYENFIIGDLKAVGNSALWRNTDEQLRLPKDADSLEAARQAMIATAGAGYKLYKLFSEDPVFREAIDLVEQLPDESKITVITDDVVFPWELFYPLTDGYPEESYKREKFWGNRFIIESLLMATSTAEKLPASRQQTGNLHVSMGLNESIDQDPVWKGRTLLPVQFQQKYFAKAWSKRGDYAAGYKQVLSALRKEPAVASLIYFFCHGSAEKLEFEKSTSFTPYHVAGPEFPQWPVVFVNACEAGNISPLSFFSFRKEFRKRKSAGLIAPSFPIPTLFAAVFASAFLERYARQETVGSILLALRRQLLRQNNPLGLWYSLQCPLDLKAPEV